MSPPATDNEDSLTEDEQVEVISSSSKRGQKRKRAPTTFRTTKKGKQARVAQSPDSSHYSHTSESYQDDSQHLTPSQDNPHPTPSQNNPPVPSSSSSLPPTQPHSEDAGHHE